MQITFAPLIPWPFIAALAALCALALAFALWRRGLAPGLRALALLVGLAALAGPQLEQRSLQALDDIVVVVSDQSSSAQLDIRADQLSAAVQDLIAQLGALGVSDIRQVSVEDAPQGGTLAMAGLTEALADIPRDRLAGVFVISDGVVHDSAQAPALPAPLHLLRLGRADEWDRRLIVPQVPAFGVVGEELPITLKITDSGAAPETGQVPVELSFDAGEPYHFNVPLDRETALPIPLPHAGANTLRITTPAAEGELTERNNTVVLQVNGIRDRLRVLLISGEPYAGERTWRNLLKSDGNVELVHFTILRSQDNMNLVPVEEMSLIAFPTEELFLDKIVNFDLIIFDRYPLRGIVQAQHLDNIRLYAEQGGAVLVAAGPDFAGAQSLARSPLGAVLPARPTARVVEDAYVPQVTDLGTRHPVTRDLPGAPDWGAWQRLIEVNQQAGDVLMEGAEGRPLLILDHVGEGRVALLASDQAWLWDRGYDGGGPHRELLRRLAHWLMKEPELEENTLLATPEPGGLRITRRSLEGDAPEVTIIAPDGTEQSLVLREDAPGVFSGVVAGAQDGFYKISQGDLSTVAVMGAIAPLEYETPLSTAAPLADAIAQSGGTDWLLEDGMPRVRAVTGRAFGPGWVGITPRDASRVTGLQVAEILPAWAWLALAAGLALLAWLWEGRERR